MPTPDVYSSLDAKAIAQDRREMKLKIQRHKKPQNISKDGNIENALHTGEQHIIYDASIEDNNQTLDSEGYDSMHQALYQEKAINQRQEDPISSEGKNSKKNVFGKRGDSHTTMDTTSMTSKDNYGCVKFEISNTQSSNKRLLSIAYIILVLILLFSYGFFLESAKFVHYES